MIDRFSFAGFTASADAVDNELLEAVAASLRKHGCVILDDLFRPDFVQQMQASFLTRYTEEGAGGPIEYSREVGDKRNLISLEFTEPFNSPELYANPVINGVVSRSLGDKYFLGSFSAVSSRPGAEMQHRHRDHRDLFIEFPSALLPPYAIQVFIPLVALTSETGTTRLWPGSHLHGMAELDEDRFGDPLLPIGSCGLMDYRVIHRGLPNRSTIVRPILYLLYHRPWFKDYNNHPRTPLLSISEREYRRIPDEYRDLFSWLEHDTTRTFVR